MAKKDKTRNQSYSGESIASKLLSGTGIGKLLGYGDNTYTDGYGVTRENAPLSESAQGQQLDRMKDTAVNAANLVAAGAAFGNPITAETWLAPVITAAQAYYAGAGLHDGINRVESMVEDPSQRTAENVLITGLETLPVIPAAKTVIKGAKEVVPAAKQMVKEAEAVDYAGRQADAAAATAAKGTVNNTGVTDVVKSEPYARIAPSDGRINTAVNYGLRYDPQNTVQLVSDTEPGYYSVHFKTNQGSQTSNNIQSVVDQIVTDLPAGAKLGTWGSVSKGGFSGLNRFREAGMIRTDEYRPLAFKDPSIANEVAEKYGLTLNPDGTINWPIRTKPITEPFGQQAYRAWQSLKREGYPTIEYEYFPQDGAIEMLAEKLQKSCPNFFNKDTFIKNFSENYDDISFILKHRNAPEDALGSTLTYMGYPTFQTHVPESVSRFYKNDVIPRLKDPVAIDRILKSLESEINVGYVPLKFGGYYLPADDSIWLSNREWFNQNNIESIIAHELHHKFRRRGGSGLDRSIEIYNPKEKDILHSFTFDNSNAPSATRDVEVASTGAEGRFALWNAFKPSTPEELNRTIDQLNDLDMHLLLPMMNSYNVTPQINGETQFDINGPHFKDAAEKVRDLLKYVPAVGAAAVLPNTTNESTNTKQESNNQL